MFLYFFIFVCLTNISWKWRDIIPIQSQQSLIKHQSEMASFWGTAHPSNSTEVKKKKRNYQNKPSICVYVYARRPMFQQCWRTVWSCIQAYHPMSEWFKRLKHYTQWQNWVRFKKRITEVICCIRTSGDQRSLWWLHMNCITLATWSLRWGIYIYLEWDCLKFCKHF